LKVVPTDLDLTPKAGTEKRYEAARLAFTAIDTFWEASTAAEVTSGTAGLENQDTLSCPNAGVITVYPIITLEPDEANQNFAIFNDTTDDVFTFSSSSFVPGSSLEIDCQNGTVYLTNVNTVTEVSNGIADGTGFLHLAPGANSLRYESAFGAVTCTVSYRRRWPF
jgi:phage-related protein